MTNMNTTRMTMTSIFQELGLNISKEQLEEMRGKLDDIDFQEAAAEERKVVDVDDINVTCPLLR